MADFHQILFNMHILYSLALGVWAIVIFARKESISGHFWGAIVTYALLAAWDFGAGRRLVALGL